MFGHQYIEVTSTPNTKQVTSNVIVNTLQKVCMSANPTYAHSRRHG